jgi:hypothetical protein
MNNGLTMTDKIKETSEGFIIRQNPRCLKCGHYFVGEKHEANMVCPVCLNDERDRGVISLLTIEQNRRNRILEKKNGWISVVVGILVLGWLYWTAWTHQQYVNKLEHIANTSSNPQEVQAANDMLDAAESPIEPDTPSY